MTNQNISPSFSLEKSPVPLRGVASLGAKEDFSFVPHGNVVSAQGFRACGVHAGFYEDPTRLDLALVVCDTSCACAGVFTKNKFCAAPVALSRQHLGSVGYGMARAVLINSGNANAACGDDGLATAREAARLTSEYLGCPKREVVVASTGVIGVHLPIELFGRALPRAKELLSRDGGIYAARAIMTTDTFPKQAAVTFSGEGIGFDGCQFTIGGMVKGSGMIMPNMATMIATITTDAPISADDLHRALSRAVCKSFNKVVVDGDTSTNDSCFLLASGAASGLHSAKFERNTAAFARFQHALDALCQHLARKIAKDGEGATRLVTVNVFDAETAKDADAAARAIATSPLVKTAIFGHDANWGRIVAALGRSEASFCQEKVGIDMMGIPVCRCGVRVDFDEEEARHRFDENEVIIDVSLGAGNCTTTVWTCDFTYDYVTINGDYRS